MSRPEIRLVEWVDSCSHNGWQPSDEAVKDHGVSNCHSVGFVIREDKTEVLLAQSEDHRFGNLAEVLAIPVVAITRQTTLRKPKENP